MRLHLHGGPGAVVLLIVLFVPGLLLAHFLHSLMWIIAFPIGLIVLMLAVAALPIKRKVSPEQWAGELEKHLLGTDGAWGWDDATSVTLSDERLERLRGRLIPRFDMLDSPEKREDLSQIIEALRRGEVP